jgi:hypothetical protein
MLGQALIVVRAGSTVPCSSTALSVMRRRVSAFELARLGHAVGDAFHRTCLFIQY